MNKNEIQQLINELNEYNEHKLDVDMFLKLYDHDHDGIIDLNEFQIAHASSLLSSSQDILLSTFQLFDQDNDGYITHQEIAQICPYLSNIQINQLIQDADIDHDGSVNLQEWSTALSKNINMFKQVEYELITRVDTILDNQNSQ